MAGACSNLAFCEIIATLLCAYSVWALPANKNYASLGRSSGKDYTTLTCYHRKSGGSLEWLRYQPNGREQLLMTNTYLNPDGTRRKYYVERIETNRLEVLRIQPIFMYDGGRYSCRDKLNTTDVFFINLVVVNTLQVCYNSPGRTLVEGTSHTCKCRSRFRGFVAPVIDFFFARRPETIHQPQHNLTLIDEADVFLYTYEFIATRDHNNRRVDSRAYFKDEYNIAEFMTYGHCMPLKIFFPPEHLYIEPQKSLYKGGDVLNVSIDRANPTPSFKWYNAETNATLSDTFEMVVPDDISGDQSFYVTATNGDRDNTWVVRETVNIRVQVVPDHVVESPLVNWVRSTTPRSIVNEEKDYLFNKVFTMSGLAVNLILLFIIAILVLYIVKKRAQKRKELKERGSTVTFADITTAPSPVPLPIPGGGRNGRPASVRNPAPKRTVPRGRGPTGRGQRRNIS